MFDPAVRAQMLAPEPATRSLPGVGGRVKERCEDFVVDEIAAYPPDGREDRHLLVRVRKRQLSTPEMLKALGVALSVDPAEIGCAGRKDRQAVTTQWISLPARVAAALGDFDHPSIEVLESRPHGQKLRTGHLRGNRFRIVIREPGMPPETALERVREKMGFLERAGGLENLYGEQRFGDDGANLERGAELLRSRRRMGNAGRFLVSALQSGLFNLYVALRREQTGLRQVLPGDVLKKVESGGMFTVEDATLEQSRLDRGELVVTGPIFGSKMRRPEAGSASARLEDEVLHLAGLGPEHFAGHGKRLPGSRRAVQVRVADFSAAEAEPAEGLPAGIELRFTLDAGSYATQLLRELQCGPQ